MSRTKKSKPSGSKKTAKPAAAVDVDAKLAENEAKTTKAVAVVEKPAEKAKTAEKLVEKTAALAINPGQVTPYKLDKAQTLKAARALLKHIAAEETSEGKTNLLADPSNPADSAIPLWLVLTTKKYISDQRSLKPTQIALPTPILPPTTTLCLIVKDPQRHFKDAVTAAGLENVITKVVGISKLKKKFKTFESRRQLCDSHDIFIADDRIVTMLPTALGSVFYKKTAKVPIAVKVADNDKPDQLKKIVQKVLDSTVAHLAASATTSVRVSLSTHTPEQVVENVAAVVDALAEKKIPGGFKNIKSLHIKSPNSASLPIYVAVDLYGDEDVLKPEEEAERLRKIEEKNQQRKDRKEARSLKRKGLSETKPVDDDKVVEAPAAKKVKKAKVEEAKE
ncbi:ribosomal protein L1p/L10e family-domain-containing protein [Pyronema domesticum]|uniref:Similar to Putative ribosome biogenesis protein C8F11.04 acc. no. Q9UT32 n=1 Tax=Pyronema omphalodes (strain CBS 100304) TaxID=1076935 RepID=U4L837_PYROM|nr:ribosomal protein L1p/L10e family-domain-containing protein [Pyronema domesticum]CCX06304.1 Similar to Putative ribosome biogenesis protein C8F11.04; acc. no. Q9UT32 [Pyronema omphalodes CBS 100304]